MGYETNATLNKTGSASRI